MRTPVSILALWLVACDPPADPGGKDTAGTTDTGSDTGAGDTDDSSLDSDDSAPDTADTADDTGSESTIAEGFVLVPALTFEMGCTAGQTDCGSDEPAHMVTLTRDYWIGAAEVSQAQFESLLGYNPSVNTACGSDCPVDSVHWHQAAAYVNALSALEGLPECFTCAGEGAAVLCEAPADPYACTGYRLPTEAEWEAAARCGTDTTYAGSDNVREVAWVASNSGGTTHPSGSKASNACGLFDMSGNLYEWTHDGYGAVEASTDPVGNAAAKERVARGGTYSYFPDTDARVSQREYFEATTSSWDDLLGIRVARTAPP